MAFWLRLCNQSQVNLLDDNALLRYSRQIMLPEIDIAGQEALAAATVLIAGVGGLGSPAALYLAAAGVGRLVLVDHDEVDLSNLQRQIAHTTDRVGENKATSAETHIHHLNPLTQVHAITEPLDNDNSDQLLSQVSAVLDCTDNFTTRHLLNDACWQRNIPLISGAAIRWEGQVTVFDPKQAHSPCYRCLYPEASSENLNCSENGVIAPLVGIVGTMQALEAIKVITGAGETLVGRLLHVDAKYMQFRELKLPRHPDCATCSSSK